MRDLSVELGKAPSNLTFGGARHATEFEWPSVPDRRVEEAEVV